MATRALSSVYVWYSHLRLVVSLTPVLLSDGPCESFSGQFLPFLTTLLLRIQTRWDGFKDDSEKHIDAT